MRVFIFLMAIITSSVIGVFSQTSTPKRYTIRYEEKVRPGNASFENQKLPAKIRRSSSNKGEINFVYFDEFPDSMKVALSAAASLWEAKISNKHPIYIGVCFDSLGPNLAMAAEVNYYGDVDSDLLGCPLDLASQIIDLALGSEDSPNSMIIFNSDLNWDCSFTGNNVKEYNMTTMALRGIARCLGFGSSVIPVDNKFSFYISWPTYFDKLLYNKSVFLSELEPLSDEMSNFIKSNNVFINTTSNIYKIYAPSQYNPEMSLNYFDEENSLMSYSLGKGNCVLSIDNKTMDILQALGWDLPDKGFKIKCTDISDNGIASSYKNHSFYLDKGDTSISSYQWKFYLKNKSEKFQLISTANSEVFTIDSIDSTDNYFININGDLEGRIECEYTVNGQVYESNPFSLSLELKPVIISIDNITKHHPEPYEYSLSFNVNYAGADDITVYVEEEYSIYMYNFYFNEPYIAHINIGNMTTLYYSWVTVEVTNQYGSVTDTKEFEPEYDSYRFNQKMTETDKITNPELIDKIQLFKLNGLLIYDGSPEELPIFNISPGMYIKKEILQDGTHIVSKLIIK